MKTYFLQNITKKWNKISNKYGNDPLFVTAIFFPLVIVASISFMISIFYSHRFFCDFFGWHRSKDILINNSTKTGHCARCGMQNLTKDSNNNWY